MKLNRKKKYEIEYKYRYLPILKAKYDCAKTLRSVGKLIVDVFIDESGKIVTSSMFKVK